MAIQDIIRRERNYDNISVLACHGYKSKAKNPRRKSRYRDITVGIPAWEIISHTS